ncbi:hypothetical protein M9458_025488, partial [Cirrhinus mrigala]
WITTLPVTSRRSSRCTTLSQPTSIPTREFEPVPTADDEGQPRATRANDRQLEPEPYTYRSGETAKRPDGECNMEQVRAMVPCTSAPLLG